MATSGATSAATSGASEGFEISFGRHFTASLVAYTTGFWQWLGDVETMVLADELESVEVEAPIYVSGLARAGSTIVLRILDTPPETVSHQYRDFPFLYIPAWWNQTLERQTAGHLETSERAHEDRLEVSPASPEAMEEVLWMQFFSDLHDPSTSNTLDAETEHAEFESFYRDHIRKLLHARDGSRYLAKGNYNVTRLEYLLDLFPEARFVLPIRHPRSHVASSRKQHRLFSEGLEGNSRALTHLKRVGHFEFGPHRRPINAGDDEAIREIEKLWESGEEVRGWARYWSHIYGFLADRLEQNADLRDASVVVRYEDLCDRTGEELERIVEHCGLAEYTDHLVDEFEEAVSRPNYYDAEFTEDEEEAIVEETLEQARRFGYDAGGTGL